MRKFQKIQIALLVLLTATLLLTAGCGTIVARTAIEGRPYQGYVYPATRTDAECVKACVTGATILHYGDCDNAGIIFPILGYTVVPFCFIVDIPISLVTDTILIPFDLVEPKKEIEPSNQSSQRDSQGRRTFDKPGRIEH